MNSTTSNDNSNTTNNNSNNNNNRNNNNNSSGRGTGREVVESITTETVTIIAIKVITTVMYSQEKYKD